MCPSLTISENDSRDALVVVHRVQVCVRVRQVPRGCRRASANRGRASPRRCVHTFCMLSNRSSQTVCDTLPWFWAEPPSGLLRCRMGTRSVHLRSLHRCSLCTLTILHKYFHVFNAGKTKNILLLNDVGRCDSNNSVSSFVSRT